MNLYHIIGFSQTFPLTHVSKGWVPSNVLVKPQPAWFIHKWSSPNFFGFPAISSRKIQKTHCFFLLLYNNTKRDLKRLCRRVARAAEETKKKARTTSLLGATKKMIGKIETNTPEGKVAFKMLRIEKNPRKWLDDSRGFLGVPLWTLNRLNQTLRDRDRDP